MRNKPKYYSREDKLHYLKLFYESGMSKSAFCRAHEIYSASVLNVWIKKYEKEASLVTLPSEDLLIRQTLWQIAVRKTTKTKMRS